MEVCPGAPQLYAAVHHPDDEHLSSSVYSDVSDSSESHGDSQHEAKARRLSGAFTPRRVEAVAELADAQWSAAESSALYNVEGWGAPYFSVNESGRILVTPMAEDGPAIDLYDLTAQAVAQGLRAPLLFRFLPIVGHRIAKLNAAFRAAIERFEYAGVYAGVFPVKCNHDKDLIQAVVDYGAPYSFGLEVGSKAELVMVMAQLAGAAPGTNLVCNGYKDEEYMELVLHCRELGLNAMVVMEQYSELGMLLGVARRLGVRPSLGIRAKLTTRHNGHWGSTSGDKAKFGLRAREIVACVNTLAEEGMLDCLNLLHFHVGSQITNIRMVKEVMREASFLYAELVQMGAVMRYIDCGGGLAVDYDGSATDSSASMSYTLQHYANDVVSAVQEVCIQRSIADPPTILTESGRALASHHSVLVFDVLTTPECLAEKRVEQEEVVESIELRDDKPMTKQLRQAARSGKGSFLLLTFKEVFDNISADASALREAYNDASYFKDEAVRAFKLGVLSLEERAAVDLMFDATCQRIAEVAAGADLPLPDALRPDAAPHTQMYHVNMSVFRSAVDSWAISQLFPIVPIHRLAEEPSVPATLADLTCDSDGKVDKFINPRGGEPLCALPLHPLRLGHKYYLGLFMTGVYQEVMGSCHNLFSSPNTVVVRAAPARAPGGGNGAAPHESMNEDGVPGGPTTTTTTAPGLQLRLPAACEGHYAIDAVVAGESIAQVLAHVNHRSHDMLHSVEAAAAGAVASGALDPAAADRLLACYAARMHGYTYMI